MQDGMSPALLHWLDNWGVCLKTKIAAAVSDTRQKLGLCSAVALPQHLRLGTDCSGLEAPVYALRGLCVQHTHEFASECASAPRRMIQENAMPAKLLSNIFSGETAPYVHVYTSGFSCKPFSMLHHGTKLLQEEQARIFFAVVQRIACIRPACFVLENVLGISRVKAQVLKTLQEQGYAVEALVMNPVDLGEPVQRPRYYFIGARLVCTMPQKTVHAFLTSAWAHIINKESGIARATLADRLLPADHPSVQRLERARKETWAQARDKGFPDKKKDAKWSQLHAKFAALHGLKQPRPGPGRCLHGGMPSPADRLHLHVPREREAWALLSQQYEKSPALVADLSQNVDRAAVRTDGALPTVTPGSHLVLREAGRVVTPIEKILVHGFPVHRMVFPAQVTDAELASMGGNTMHVHVVAVALMLATSMVDWTLPAAHDSEKGPSRRPTSKAPRPQVPRCKAPRSSKRRLPKPEQKSLPQKSHLKVRQVRKVGLASRWCLPECLKPGKKPPVHGRRLRLPGARVDPTDKLQLLAARWF